jgi:hypothetical protein
MNTQRGEYALVRGRTHSRSFEELFFLFPKKKKKNLSFKKRLLVQRPSLRSVWAARRLAQLAVN